MKLNIVTPKQALPEMEVSKVFFPGTAGKFEVLKDHAPLISALCGGEIRWDDGALEISSGFVEVKDNVIRVVAEQ